jgi:hypothetical protein
MIGWGRVWALPPNEDFLMPHRVSSTVALAAVLLTVGAGGPASARFAPPLNQWHPMMIGPGDLG